jgi:hypothetical protein
VALSPRCPAPRQQGLPTAARLQDTKKNVLTTAGLAQLGYSVFNATGACNKQLDKNSGAIAAIGNVSSAGSLLVPAPAGCLRLPGACAVAVGGG